MPVIRVRIPLGSPKKTPICKIGVFFGGNRCSVVVLPGICGIVVQAFTIPIDAVFSYDFLARIGNHEIDKPRRQRLAGGRPGRLTKRVVGVDQKGIAPEKDLKIVDLFFGRHPGAAVGHKITAVFIRHF